MLITQFTDADILLPLFYILSIFDYDHFAISLLIELFLLLFLNCFYCSTVLITMIVKYAFNCSILCFKFIIKLSVHSFIVLFVRSVKI